MSECGLNGGCDTSIGFYFHIQEITMDIEGIWGEGDAKRGPGVSTGPHRTYMCTYILLQCELIPCDSWKISRGGH